MLRLRCALLSALTLLACGGDEAKSPLDEAEAIDQPKAGQVSLATYSDGTKGYQYTVRPSFIDASGSSEANTSARCTIEESGPCRKISCPSERANLRTQSAGGIHITGGATPADLVPDFNGYTNVQESRPFFEGGEQISFSAGGSAVPAFSGGVTAPSPVLVTAPVESTVVASRSQDLTVTWTGKSAGAVVFQLSGKIDQSDVKFQCRFLPEAGTATIPKSALERLTPGDYKADIFTRSRTVVTAGTWSVALEAVYFAGVKDVGAFLRPARVE